MDLISRQPVVFRSKSDLIFYPIHNGLRLGVLREQPDVTAQSSWALPACISAEHDNTAAKATTVEVGDQTIETPNDRRLSNTGRSGDYDEPAGLYPPPELVERRELPPRITVAD